MPKDNGLTLISGSPTTGIESMRLDESPEPQVGESEHYSQTLRDISNLAKGRALTGLAPEGHVTGLVQEVDLGLLVPNPHHPRDDWKARDDLLLGSLKKQGQLTPLQVTALWPDDSYAEQGFAYMIIKGHRLYAHLRLANIPKAKIVVERTQDGQPLESYDMLRFYLTQAITQQPLKPYQVVAGFLRLKQQLEAAARASNIPALSIRSLMENFGVSEHSASDIHYILSNDTAVATAVAQQKLPLKTAYALIQQVRESDRRQTVLGQVLSENERRLDDREPLLTQKEVLQIATVALPSGDTTTTSYPTSSPPSSPPHATKLTRALLQVIQLYEETTDLRGLPEPLQDLWPLLRQLADYRKELEDLR